MIDKIKLDGRTRLIISTDRMVAAHEADVIVTQTEMQLVIELLRRIGVEIPDHK